MGNIRQSARITQPLAPPATEKGDHDGYDDAKPIFGAKDADIASNFPSIGR